MRNKYQKKRNLIITAATLLLLFIGIGYAYLETDLKISTNVHLKKKISPGLATLRKLQKLNPNIKVNDRTPDFSKTATTDEGVFSAPDDYGDSYYFRGAVENNYVKFAGYYWRIVRINGDGSIRLIYDGTSAHANGVSSEDRQIGTSVFNEDFQDNANVGYMYGKTGASTYEETHANTNSSTIKKYIDNWYTSNLASYSKYLSDTEFCSDRSITEAENTKHDDVTYSNKGYGEEMTIYAAFNRINESKAPILTCTNKNDRFTVSDITTGNGALTYPIGLLTADEASMAGVTTSISTSSYLCSKDNYWLGSPYCYDSMSLFFGAVEYSMKEFSSSLVGKDVTIGTGSGGEAENALGVRPVVNLKSNTTFSGTGTMSDPLVVS